MQAATKKGEIELQWKEKIVNRNTYNISSIKRVTRTFLENSRRRSCETSSILMIRFQSVYHCICMFYRLTWLEGFYFRGILTLIKPVGVCLGETHVKFDDTYLQRGSELSPSKESILLCTIIFPLKLTWQRAIFNNSFNRPFYSYRWKRGWSWSCFDTTLPALLCKSCCFYWC